MRKKLTLVSVLFACFFTANIFAQTITVTVNGIAKLDGQTNNTGITVTAKSYNIDGSDVFGIDETVTTNADGEYTFSFTVQPCIGTFCVEIGAIPLYLSFTKNTLIDSINENLPVSQPYVDFNYTITKTPVLGAYIPQICLVTVDTAVNKHMIAWERKNDANILRYNILKASTYNGSYDSIDNVSQSVQYSVYRDKKTIAGTSAFYKIQAVYVNGTKSPASYPKKPLSIRITPNDTIRSLQFINKDDIPLFDHGLYKSITVMRSYQNRKFIAYKNFDFSKTAGMLGMIAGLEDTLKAVGKYYYLAVAELYHSCTPSLLKSDSGPFSQSMSNLAESELTLTESGIVTEISLAVSPNPSKGSISITVPEAGTISIINTIGQTISSLDVQKGITQVKIESAGIYTIILNGSKVYKAKVAIE